MEARPVQWEQIEEALRVAELGFAGRVDVLKLYALRKRGRDVTIRIPRGKAFLHGATLPSDWESFREIFVPRKNAYKTDYRGATVVDVGAHKGYFGAYALLSGAHAVQSYEPEPANFSALRSARDALGATGWSLHQAAVGATSGRRTLNVSTESWTHSLGPIEDAVATLEVDVVGINDVLADLPAHLVLKIDIEGTEGNVLRAVDASFWPKVHALFVETHPLGDITADEIEAALTEHGFIRDETPDPAVVRMIRPPA